MKLPEFKALRQMTPFHRLLVFNDTVSADSFNPPNALNVHGWNFDLIAEVMVPPKNGD